MNISEEKSKLFNLLFQLDEYSQKINEITTEINTITQKMNLPPININSSIEQINKEIKSSKSNINNYYSQFRTNKIENVPIENDLKIYIGFKQPSGVVHTFEAQYGTTVDKLISTYINQILNGQNNNEYAFVYNEHVLNVGDMNLIENVFSDRQDPTIIIKRIEELNINNNQVNNDTDFHFILE